LASVEQRRVGTRRSKGLSEGSITVIKCGAIVKVACTVLF